MSVVKLFKVEEPEQTLAAVFDDGDHVIGRGTVRLNFIRIINKLLIVYF